MTKVHPFLIPTRLNLAISAVQIAALLALLRASATASGWWLFAVALGYGLVMNSAYAMLHEAEHGLLHSNRKINEAVGVLLALFFPAPFHLIRQGHLGHHLRNRSDDEAFDFYFEGESRVWRFMQLYGILTGLFWAVIFLSNILAIFSAGLLRPKTVAFDRATSSLLASLNPQFVPFVRLEALAAAVLHVVLIWIWQIPLWHWLLTLASFGILWSAMQYVHHFGTERDVAKGAVNLRVPRLIGWLWLNHHWHLQHHLSPTVPWLYLPTLHADNPPKDHMLLAYLRMWKGPRMTREHVENRYAGKIIR